MLQFVEVADVPIPPDRVLDRGGTAVVDGPLTVYGTYELSGASQLTAAGQTVAKGGVFVQSGGENNAGSEFAVAVDNASNGLLLCLEHENVRGRSYYN